jgi:hypothetical protein
VFYSTCDETTWLVAGELSGNCSAVVSLIPRVQVALDEKPVEINLSNCIDLCHLVPEMTSGVCCHSYLKFQVNRPVAAVDFRSSLPITLAIARQGPLTLI